jgi:hypothetical protein
LRNIDKAPTIHTFPGANPKDRGGKLMRPNAIGNTLATLTILLFASTSPAKDKKKVSNLFDAPPAKVFDSVYRYAQHNGTIKLVDEKRFTLSGVIIVPGGWI